MNEKRVEALSDALLEKVSGGSYFKYTLDDGTTLWGVYDEKTGDFDPGYKTLKKAKEADKKINGRALRTPSIELDILC